MGMDERRRRRRRRRRRAFVQTVVLAFALARVSEGQTLFRKLHAWGENKFGELGLGEGLGLNTCSDGEIIELGSELQGTLSRVSAGLNHAVALTADGKLYAWGRNECGQLGVGDIATRYRPTRINSLDGVPIVDVAVGIEHSLALASDGRLYGFGCNGRGSLGLGPTSLGSFLQPTLVSTPATFVEIAAGSQHSVGRTASGEVFTWGANDQGQLGLGGCLTPGGPGNDACLNDVYVPTKVTSTSTGIALPQIKLIAAGGGQVSTGSRHFSQGGHTLAVTTANEVYAWGDNFHGQLGVKQVYRQIGGSAAYTPNKYDSMTGLYYNRHELPTKTEPFAIDIKAGTSAEIGKPTVLVIKEIDAGSFHSLMLIETGEIFAWGDNYYGQIGLGYASRNSEPTQYYATRNYSEPQMIDQPKRIKKFDFVSLEMNQNSVFVNYTITGKLFEENNATFTKISAGGYTSMAITSNNKLFVWGINKEGQLGTCGCGGCANYGAADPGTCKSSTQLSFVNDETCKCKCGGIGTCVYTETDTLPLNLGKCNATETTATCMCEGIMKGKLEVMDEPMISALHVSPKAFRDVVYASAGGGGVFALTQSICKDNNNGTVCSGSGTCQADGSCACFIGHGGDSCENSCPNATDADEALVIKLGVTDDAISGKLCSGHGTCDPNSATCVCDAGHYGPRCALICPVDDAGRTCSGNGTCAYNVNASAFPYCECSRSQDPGWCATHGLKIQPEGWCSYHGGADNGGFAACYSVGHCGMCQSAPASAFVTSAWLIFAAFFAAFV